MIGLQADGSLEESQTVALFASGRLFGRELTAALVASGRLFGRELTAALKVSGRLFEQELTAALVLSGRLVGRLLCESSESLKRRGFSLQIVCQHT